MQLTPLLFRGVYRNPPPSDADAEPSTFTRKGQRYYVIDDSNGQHKAALRRAINRYTVALSQPASSLVAAISTPAVISTHEQLETLYTRLIRAAQDTYSNS